jgi:KUP system potassium uptake protein
VYDAKVLTNALPTPHAQSGSRYFLTLALGALGVVYGDIGTSPLYALRESLAHGLAPTQSTVLGLLSLIFWSLVLVISLKYVTFVLRADNGGEGGILALTALLTPFRLRRGSTRWLLILLGIFGTALLYGDGIITPAISVLSAVEGLELALPSLEPYIVPIAIVILVMLFLIQPRGTGAVGRLFGPIMIVWFITLAVLGVIHIFDKPSILAALSPGYAFQFFATHGWQGFLVLGSVFLVTTGGEALYADMGHFGKKPIRLAWFALVLPALLLNYFGQGALVLEHPEFADNPFYRMVPAWALLPLVALSTMATIIASQALISGAFSLSMQAMRLGYTPRLNIRHTSAQERGQIFVPTINWLLMIACIGLVLGFRESSNLAAAYGIAVSLTMIITTLLFIVLINKVWNWPKYVVIPLAVLFLSIDAAFLTANLFKIPQGGWFPLVIGVIVFTQLTTWKRGTALVTQRLHEGGLELGKFLNQVRKKSPQRVPGTAVFMTRNLNAVPLALLSNLKYNHVLHETTVLLDVITEDVPRVLLANRAQVKSLGQGFYQVSLHFGFMEESDVPKALARIVHEDICFNPQCTNYFLGSQTLFATNHPGMALWREKLFIAMYRNAGSAIEYFKLPPERVMEVGIQLGL